MMSDEMEELPRRLVVAHKSDGRSVDDEAAKAELVAACGRPGASVSRLARECGVNANQLSRWVREHSQRRQRAVAVPFRVHANDGCGSTSYVCTQGLSNRPAADPRPSRSAR
jgi:transposase